jgi:hypothetical protein
MEGWVNYFRIGNSNHIFDKLRYFIEEEVKRFVSRKKGRASKSPFSTMKGRQWAFMHKKAIHPSLRYVPQIRR